MEIDRLDYWAEDRKKTLDEKLKEMDKKRRILKKEFRKSSLLDEKLKLQKQINDLEKKRDKEWKEYDIAKKEIETKKDQLIDEIQTCVKQTIIEDIVFEIEWEII